MSEKLQIFDVSYEGAGVGRLAGQVVFVPKTLPGEHVEIEIVKKSNSFLVGKLLKVEVPNPERISPICPHFDVCGGCAFLQCTQEYEQKLKTQILQKELSKVGFLGKIKFVSSATRFAYRNKIKLETVDGKLGYFQPKSHHFFEVETCPIADKKIENALPLVKKILQENSFKNLKNVYFKVAEEDVAICFLFNKNAKFLPNNAKKLQIFADFSVFFAFGDVLESNETKVFHVLGKKNLIKDFGNFSYEISVDAFNQVNDSVAEKLYKFLQNQAAGKRVVNAFSGQGLLTHLLAQNAKFVYGIELQKSAHESAQSLTESLQNVQNFCAKVEEKLPEILQFDKIDLIVLDPAREGCKNQALQAISEAKVESVIYVSCNFSTLVRDLQVLGQYYSIESVAIFDMFPGTCKMETVAILRAK